MRRLFYGLKRFNRRYRQLVNLTLTTTVIAILCAVILVSFNGQMTGLREAYDAETRFLHSRLDSLMVETDRMRTGIDINSARRFKVNTGAEIIRSVAKNMGEGASLRLAGLIYDECERVGNVDFSFALAIITVESRFNNDAVSYVGARGIMQVMPGTFYYVAKSIGMEVTDGSIGNLTQNLRVGMHYIARLHTQYPDYKLVAAGYNGGPGGAEVYRKYILGEVNSERVHPQTMDYVSKVHGLYIKYRKELCE